MADSALNNYQLTRSRNDLDSVCHAPARNLFFTNTGVVLSCCFNRAYEVGRYPEQSIQQIWESEKITELRNSLRQNDFSLGCAGCKMILESGNYDSLPAKNYDNFKGNSKNFPVSFEFELSNTCNLECIMCSGEFSSSIRENREKRSAIKSPYGEKFIEELEFYLPYLERAQFLGGEPFLIPVYFDIWERITKINPGISISVQTNATILNNRVKKILNELSFSISVSIDGVSKKVYESIRLNTNFERVMENLKFYSKLCKEKNKNLSLSFCPMPQNAHEIPALIELANHLGALVFFNTVFDPPHCSLMNMGKTELKKLHDFLKTQTPDAATSLEKQNRNAYLQLSAQINQWSLQNENHSVLSTHIQHKSIDDLLQKISYELKRRNEKKYEKERVIEQRLTYILQRATEENIYEESFKGIMSLNINSIVDSVAIIEKERLYQMFKDRVLPRKQS